ncbi:hypothetical protein VIGAN_06109000 [Vigna angularis var. angularis]|uniref:Uncharacterized protein n=1 Tax=Vigna angularis var. angularis TaxID=157739 RepID=A0A0S3SAS1_PHAAN|nr:hypothetical protein VIGAN_06109000 [Vigna angularis var. angularis]
MLLDMPKKIRFWAPPISTSACLLLQLRFTPFQPFQGFSSLHCCMLLNGSSFSLPVHTKTAAAHREELFLLPAEIKPCTPSPSIQPFASHFVAAGRFLLCWTVSCFWMGGHCWNVEVAGA